LIRKIELTVQVAVFDYIKIGNDQPAYSGLTKAAAAFEPKPPAPAMPTHLEANTVFYVFGIPSISLNLWGKYTI